MNRLSTDDRSRVLAGLGSRQSRRKKSPARGGKKKNEILETKIN
jgi:hypothetical protein